MADAGDHPSQLSTYFAVNLPPSDRRKSNWIAIAAMAQNRVIGAGDRIPWHLPDDLHWFQQITTGQTLVMGRKTFEAIGKPLPGRTTIVLSRSSRCIPGVRVIASLEELEAITAAGKIFICGGAEVYAQTLPLCSELYVTLVKRNVEGDRFFPAFEERFAPAAVILDNPEFQVTRYRRRVDQEPSLPSARSSRG